MRRSLLVIGLVLGLLPRPAVADMCGGFPELGGFLPMGLLQPPNTVFFSGCSKVYTLKLGASPGPDGNYILLDLPPCPSGPCAGLSGASQLGCAAASGWACCLAFDQIVPTMTGTNVGTADTDPRPGICRSAYVGNGARLALVDLAEFPGSSRTEIQLKVACNVFLVAPPAGTGQATTVTLEFLGIDVTPARPTSWGHIKLLYR